MAFKVTNLEIESLAARGQDGSVIFPEVFHDKTLGAKTIYWFGRLESEVLKRSKDYGEAKKKILEGGCKKDEQNNPIVKDGRYQWEEGEERKALEKLDTLLEAKVDIGIDRLKLKLKTLEGKMTADDIRRLFPFVEFTDMDDKSPDPEPKKEDKPAVVEAIE